MLHSMKEDTAPDMLRLFDAAIQHTSARTWAEIGRLIDESDQTLTNWKKRGIPEGKLLDVAAKVKANPYWLRDGGDLPMINVYTIDRDLGDLLRVAEPLPQDYKRFLVQESIALTKLSKPPSNGTK